MAIVPAWSVVIDGAEDATSALARCLLSLSVTDESGFKSDTANIVVDDSHRVTLPEKGARMTIRMGYDETLAVMGTFTLDRITVSGPPDTLTLTGSGADFRDNLKSLKTRSFDNIAIPALLETLGADNGYAVQTAAKFAGIVLNHIDQTNESDLNLITRIAADYGGIAKITGRDIVFTERGAGLSASGIRLAPVSLAMEQLTSWSLTISDQPKYGAVSARYPDLAGGGDKTVTAGSGEPVYSLNHTYPNETSALAAANARLVAINADTMSLNATLPGDTRLMAETPVTLTGGRSSLNRRWIIRRATHTITAGGYSTSVDAAPA